MKILGIDYGKKKIGLAIGDTKTKLVEPLDVVRFKEESEIIGKIEQVVQVEQAEQVVVGVSEGEMAEESKKFADKLKEELGVPVILQDETMSTQMAQRLAIEAGIKRKKRKKLEDAYSATLILQRHLESE